MTRKQICFHLAQAHRLLPHGQRPTEKHVRIGQLLANWSGSRPTHRRLAAAASCSVGTVKNALNRLQALGLLEWRRQFIRGRQIANRYLFAAFALEAVAAALEAKKEQVLNNAFWSPKFGRLFQPHPVVRTPEEQIAAISGLSLAVGAC
jgi:DNA-binding transcriptional MocR family regulator